MTCVELADLLGQRASKNDSKQLTALRYHFRTSASREELRMCGHLQASWCRQYIRTVKKLKKLPHIHLYIGMKLTQRKLPGYTPMLKTIGEINQITVHRWGKGAFILKKHNKP